jgi:hypothetical protein
VVHLQSVLQTIIPINAFAPLGLNRIHIQILLVSVKALVRIIHVIHLPFVKIQNKELCVNALLEQQGMRIVLDV